MADEPADLSDVSIEPSVRPIGVLAGRRTDATTRPLGVLPPFSGVLTPTAASTPSGGAGPRLEYLTLRPLVVQTLESGDSGPAQAGRVGQPDDGAGRRTTESTTGGDDAEQLTVRELIREAGSGEGPDADPSMVTGQSPFHGEESDASLSQTGSPGSETARTVVERWQPPSSLGGGSDRTPGAPGEERRGADTGGGDRVSRPDRPSTTSPGQGADLSGPGLDRGSRRGGAGEHHRPTGDRPSGTVSPASGLTDDRGVETPLVVHEAGPGTRERRPGDDESRSSADTGADRRAGDRPDQTVSSRPAISDGPDEGTQSQADSQTRHGPSIPLESFHSQAFDRFVDELSRKLDRKARIERERRGE